MPYTFHDTLTLDASRALTSSALHDSIRRERHAKRTQIFPTHVDGAPPRISTGVVSAARAKVQHFAIRALRDDGPDVVVSGVHATAAVHAEEAFMISRVDRAGPVLVDAGCAIAMLTSGTAA